MGHTCERRILEAGPLAQVEQCGCGVVHLTLGALTLRLEPQALSELAAGLRRAAGNLREGTPLEDLGLVSSLKH